MQTGKVKVTEWTNYSLSARLRAGAMGVPFVPTRNLLGTDTFEYSGSIIVECPYTGKKLALQPALYRMWPLSTFTSRTCTAMSG